MSHTVVPNSIDTLSFLDSHRSPKMNAGFAFVARDSLRQLCRGLQLVYIYIIFFFFEGHIAESITEEWDWCQRSFEGTAVCLPK